MGISLCVREYLRRLYRRRGIFYFLYRSRGEPTYPLLCLHWAYWSARAAIKGNPLVHFIGDSHTTAFNFQPRFLTHHIGQATAHNLRNEKSTTSSGKIMRKVLSKINKKRDIIALVFGEIDCRIHFHYQHEKTGTPIAQLIDATISNYGDVMLSLRNAGYKICVCSTAPAARQQNIYGYPFYGTAQARSKITKEFNEKLRIFCEKNSIHFIGVYSQFSDANGFTLPEYVADEVHLNSKICPFVRSEIRRAFNLQL